ncbi:MAG: hypothetical protein V4539_08690 [Bacteroidota bacterium]
MRIERKYIQQYIHSIAIDQIADEYRGKGYEVSLETNIGNYMADIVARKENETIVIEVKAGRMTKDRKKALAEIANYIRSIPNYTFLVVLASPPKEKKIEIEGIEHLLFTHFLNNLPDELDQLSSHTRVDDVADVEIEELEINQAGIIFLTGDGSVRVSLQAGSDSDNEGSEDLYSTFPFSFEIELEWNVTMWQIGNPDEAEIEVDTSSFYE